MCVDIVGRTLQPDAADVTLAALSIRAGGGAVNCAVAATAEGAQVELIGLLGNDTFAELITHRLAAANIATANIKTMPGRTGTVISLVGADGRTKFYSYRGVNAQAYGDLPPGLIHENDWLYLSGYSFQDGGSRATAEKLLAAGAKCALDPSHQFARDFARKYRGTLRQVDLLLPNREEAHLMTGLASPEKSSAALRDLGAKMVVVKLGADGCYIDNGSTAGYLPAEPALALDTTGAGDTFAGAFLAALLRGADALNAARAANHAAHRLVTGER